MLISLLSVIIFSIICFGALSGEAAFPKEILLRLKYFLDWVFREKVHQSGLRTPPKKGKRATPSEHHSVTFIVPHRNVDRLEEDLMKVSSPNSPQYGQHWTKEQVRDLTSNPVASRAIISYLNKKGALIDFISVDEDWITASAPISLWEEVFHTEFHEYHHEDWENKIVRSQQYYLPKQLHEYVSTVLHVTHFPVKVDNPMVIEESPVVTGIAAAEDTDATISPVDEPVRNNGRRLQVKYKATKAQSAYPGLLQEWYGLLGVTGSPQTNILLFETNGQAYNPADLNAFQSLYNVPAFIQPVFNHSGGGGVSATACSSLSSKCTQASADVEYTIALSRNVRTSMYYMNSPDFLIFLQRIYDKSNQTVPHVISFTGNVAYEDDYDANYKTQFSFLAIKLGLLGCTLIASSGMDGVAGYKARGKVNACGYYPQFPASCPFVTAVGITTVRSKLFDRVLHHIDFTLLS